MLPLLAVVGLLLLAACHPPPEFARNIEPADLLFQGDPEVANGVRIYLSSPRHSTSGSRGECGWEENINGRLVNLEAATATYGDHGLADDWEYDVVVSGNPRDDGFLKNRDASNNYGADLHLSTHTNANVGCGNSAQYVLAMFRSTNPRSSALATELLENLDPIVPGHRNSWNCDNLAECGVQAPDVAYLELFFHTNQAAADWFMAAATPHDNASVDHCPDGHCGWAQSGQAVATAIDDHLGNPRPLPDALRDPLDAYPGFGRTPEAMLRDDTIAYWEAYRRELVVDACMEGAGFDYAPAVAYPSDAMLRIAENLPTAHTQMDIPSDPPDEQNRAYEHGLSPAEQDRYNRTLYDETAADIAAARAEGAAPDGRGVDFATGGCKGRANAAIPSIWDARHALFHELVDTRDSNPQQLGDTAEDLEDLVADHAPRLATVEARYEGVMERIAQDSDFLGYLAQQVQLTGGS